MISPPPRTTTALDFAPALGSLTREQCENVLTRNIVGRLAFSLHDHVSIVPVHFVYKEGWIYGRTAPGGKLLDIVRNRRIAFEVDEDEGFFIWRSVVVHGSFYLIDPERSAKEAEAHALATQLLRRVLPTSLSEADPVPFRTELFRIQVSEISGRFSSLGGTKIKPTSDARANGYPADAEIDTLLVATVRHAITKVCPNTSRVRVDAFDDLVVLSGVVETVGERRAIERAILNLDNVHALVQQLETDLPAQIHKGPAELARDALRELRGSEPQGDAAIKIVIEHDWLRAEGTAATATAKEEVLRRLRGVRGLRGVIDRIIVPTGRVPQVRNSPTK